VGGGKHRRWRAGLSVEKGAWPPPEKNLFFVPKVIKNDAVFNRKHVRTVTRSLGTWILRFSRETKLTTVQKLF